MGDYYAGRGLARPSWKRSGWRRRIGQWLRFELALEPWDFDEIGSLLDLGAGTGDLCGYLRATGRAAEYTGVESRAEAVAEAREAYPGGEFVERDFFGEWGVEELGREEGFDLVVAIGAQVDGRPAETPRERSRRAGRLWGRLGGLSGGRRSMVLLDQQTVERRPMLELEPALWGVTAEQLRGLVEEGVVRADALETDLVCYGYRAGAAFDRRVVDGEAEAWRAHRRVARRHRAEGGDPIDICWMWVEAGRAERARAVLQEDDPPDSAERRLLEERIAGLL